MKKIMVISIVAIALIAAGIAFAGIVGSRHDLSRYSDMSGGPCSACHHPHTGCGTSTSLLWNNQNWDDTAYDTYRNATVGQLTATSAFESWACMSCHDGSFGASALIRGSNTASGNMSSTVDLTSDNVELRNDHPINVNMNTSDPLFKANVATKLFSGKVQCASCHDVHNGTAQTRMFLYASLTASAICTDCHNK